MAPALTKGRHRRLSRPGQLDLFGIAGPEKNCRHALGQDVAALDFGKVDVQCVVALDKADNTPPAGPNNVTGPAWFAAVRTDHRLPLSAISLARVIADGRLRSAVELADATGFSLRMIPWAAAWLERAGWVVRLRGGGQGRKTEYVLTVPGGTP